ncbi:cupredoxin domain-containing protein [Nodosilinea nodulosa]|uniref:cupredoxin domain-containing protein n=1 Tax=Nodosilinea nodulosa TaxID=416001 RepID=UPI00031D4BE5|nr:cupredoxin domain-containing protein [Nodosilinea nodulosa]
MPLKPFILNSLLSLALLLVLASSGPAQTPHSAMDNAAADPPGQFQRIEQPLWTKVAVTGGGLSLVGLELWWFLLSKPRSRQAAIAGGRQDITITVDGGYEPSQIVVQAGQPVRLNFYRKDPSSCLEAVRFPGFRIAKDLPINETTAIEFTPEQPGRYEFTCGMNMFRGTVEVRAGAVAPSGSASGDRSA